MSDSKERIEEALGSKGRIRILRALAKEGGASLYKISKETGLSTKNVKRNLEKLVKLGWVEEFKLSGSIQYRLNERRNEVKKLIEFFEKIGYLGN